ncbi:MAG: ShlB/FhaC/HecB family hemolysin secretion/activation protein [Pseudomonadota bacterium]
MESATDSRRRAGARAGAFVAAALAVAAPPPAAAQVGAPPSAVFSLPDAARELRRTQDLERRARPLEGVPELTFTSQTPPANAGEIAFALEEIVLEGGTIYPPGELDDIWADRLGERITLAELFSIAGRIQARHREDGYLFTRVVVPAQRIEDGVARLEIIEAVLTVVEVEEPAAPIGPVAELARRYAAPLEGRRNPTLAELERVLLLINDIPGITRAAAVPKLGEGERGAVELYINVERDALALTVFADNRQSPILGRGLIGAVGAFNSWSPYGDTTSVALFNSADFDDAFARDFHERWTVEVSHSHYVGASGLRLDATFLRSESRPGGTIADFDISADQTELTLAARYPALLGRALRLDVFGGFEAIEVNSLTPAFEILGEPVGEDLVVEDSLRVVFLGVEAQQRDALGATEGRLELRHGLGLLGASEEGDADLSREDGRGRFTLLRGEVERTLTLNEHFSLWGKGWGQVADGPLLASEEMSVGGGDLGAAYHPSEYAGDVGIGAAVELRYGDTFRWRRYSAPWEAYGFADAAEIRNLDGGEPVHENIASAGLGLRAQFPGRFAVNLELAKPLNQPLQYDQSDKWRLLFSATKEF